MGDNKVPPDVREKLDVRRRQYAGFRRSVLALGGTDAAAADYVDRYGVPVGGPNARLDHALAAALVSVEAADD